MKEELRKIWDIGSRDDKEKITNYLAPLSNEQLFQLSSDILDDSPFHYSQALEFIISKLYSDEDRFIELLIKLLDRTLPDLSFEVSIRKPLERIIISQPDKTIVIVKKVMRMGSRPGVSSGILISPLLDKVVSDTIACLESDDPVLQLHAIVAIHNLFIAKNNSTASIFIPKLLEHAPKIHKNNADILTQTLISAYLIYPDKTYPVLENCIKQNGYTAAEVYVYFTHNRDKFPVSLLKKSVEIIEDEMPNNPQLIDEGLSKIYETDRDFVIERLRRRLHDQNNRELASWILMESIRNTDKDTFLHFLEQELDNGQWRMTYFGNHILADFFSSSDELLSWCQKWKDDKKKRKVILRSLANILTGLMNYAPSKIRDTAILLVKEFAKENNLDFDKETKHISLGKDPNSGAENKEATIKSLYILKELSNPKILLDTDVLEKNLQRYPYLSKAIGKDWLIKNAKSTSPHLLAYFYTQEVDLDELSNLTNQFNSEHNEKKRLDLAWRCNNLMEIARTQLYWEHIFQILSENKIIIPSRKLHDVDNAESILAEAEIWARLAPHFKICLEPDIEAFRPNNLDGSIEIDNQKILVEIAVVKRTIELEVAQGVISLPGGKVKNVLLSKFKGQLNSGKTDPKSPVVIILNLTSVNNHHDVEDALYGQFQFYWSTKTDTHETVENGGTRAENSLYEEEHANIISAVAAYNRDYAKEDPLVGKIYRPPIKPINPVSLTTHTKLRDALFGESECSNWKTLMKIDGVEEDVAKKLRANGIDDLNALTIATESDLNIYDFDSTRLRAFQNEARRVATALSTDSIRFLKGMSKEAYQIITKKGIHLISQLAKLTAPLEGIDETSWNTIKSDIERIKK